MKAMEIEKELGIPSGSVSSLLTQLSKVEAIDRDGETPLGYTFRKVPPTGLKEANYKSKKYKAKHGMAPSSPRIIDRIKAHLSSNPRREYTSRELMKILKLKPGSIRSALDSAAHNGEVRRIDDQTPYRYCTLRPNDPVIEDLVRGPDPDRPPQPKTSKVASGSTAIEKVRLAWEFEAMAERLAALHDKALRLAEECLK